MGLCVQYLVIYGRPSTEDPFVREHTRLPTMSCASAPSNAVVLVNFGSTEVPTATALRSFAREFLSDRRVVDVQCSIWYPTP